MRTEVDRGTRRVTLRSGTVTRADFPSTPAKEQTYVRMIEKAVLHEKVIGLDRLEASLSIQEEALKGVTPPWISCESRARGGVRLRHRVAARSSARTVAGSVG